MFTVGDASKILGIPRRKIVLFVEQKVMAPTVGAGGRGHARKFSILDLFRLAAVAELSRLGLSPRYLAGSARVFDHARILVAGEDDNEEGDVKQAWGHFDPQKMRQALPAFIVLAPDWDGAAMLIEKEDGLEFAAVSPVAIVVQFQRMFDEFLDRVERFWRGT
jgi:hypothetical protein